MSIHIPWATEAQLTETTTGTNFVGSLRDCLQHFAQLDVAARANALLIADSAVPLPDRSAIKILEGGELTMLLSQFNARPMSTPFVADLLKRSSVQTHTPLRTLLRQVRMNGSAYSLL